MDFAPPGVDLRNGNKQEEHLACLNFTIKDKPGILAQVLSIFSSFKISLKHIESRPSRLPEAALIQSDNKDIKVANEHYDFFTEFAVKSPKQMQDLLISLRPLTAKIDVISPSHSLRKDTIGNRSL